MATDLFVYILLGFVQVCTAIWGGIVSARAMQAGRERTTHIVIFVVLGVMGLAIIVWSGIRNYDMQAANSKAQTTLQTDVTEARRQMDQSVHREEYMRGQLESIGVMLGKVGEKASDPAIGQLAGAITKMADNAKVSSPLASVMPDLHLGILYEGLDLNGRSITSSGDNAKAIKLSEFQIHNGADRATGAVSLRLYFSKPVTPASAYTPEFPWRTTSSEERSFPAAFHSVGNTIIVNPTETWNWPAFSGQLADDLDEISARLKVYYGSARPAEASFVVRRKK